MAIKRISAAEAVTMSSVGYKMIDIRTPEEYGKGHPKGAQNVPWQFYGKGGTFKANDLFLPVMNKLFPKESKLLIVGKIGKRSLKVCEVLEADGYVDLLDLRAGYKGLVNADNDYEEHGWETMGLATETQTDGGSYEEVRAKAEL